MADSFQHSTELDKYQVLTATNMIMAVFWFDDYCDDAVSSCETSVSIQQTQKAANYGDEIAGSVKSS